MCWTRLPSAGCTPALGRGFVLKQSHLLRGPSCVPQSETGENIPSVFVLWNNLRGFYLHYRVIILHFTLIGRMWVMPGIECCARGSKGGSGHFPDTRASSDHGIHGADMETHVTSTQPALTCQMRGNYERILRTLD